MKFELSDKEIKRAKKWTNKHKCTLKYPKLTYCFTITGIGNGVDVKCDCGKSKDITDYNLW